MSRGAQGSAPRRRGATALVAAAACGLVLAALGLQSVRERRYTLNTRGDAALYVRSPDTLRRAVLSFDAVAADIYWIRAIQHYGGTRLSKEGDKRYPLLYPLIDLATSLDPRFMVAYRFGAVFLAESPPDGPGRPDLSLALLKKGIEANPDHWQYAMDTGFIYYWWLQDYKAAALWFERAAGMPGGSWWLRSLAAATLAEGGDRTSSRQMWRQILETADHDWLRNNARLKLAQLDALDQMDGLSALVSRYEQATDRFPESWMSLANAGLTRGIPVDPAGAPYVLDPAAPGGVALSASSPLSPLPPQFTKKASPSR